MVLAIQVPQDGPYAEVWRWVRSQGEWQTRVFGTFGELADALSVTHVDVVLAASGELSLPVIASLRIRYSNVDFVLVTEKSDFGWAEDALLAGVVGFLRVPCAPDRLDGLMSLVRMRRLSRIPVVIGKSPAREAVDYSRPIESAIVYVHEHLSERLTVDDVSRRVYLSRWHFSRLFQRATGMSFNDYVTTKRIEAAKALLLETGYPVDVIAATVGFSTPSYFSSTFKRLVGMTPRAYRASGLARSPSTSRSPRYRSGPSGT